MPELDLPIKIVNRDINPASENPDFAIRLGTGAWAAFDAWPMFDKVYFPTRATLEDMSRANLLVLKEWLRPPEDWRTFFERLGQPPASRARVDIFRRPADPSCLCHGRAGGGFWLEGHVGQPAANGILDAARDGGSAFGTQILSRGPQRNARNRDGVRVPRLAFERGSNDPAG